MRRILLRVAYDGTAYHGWQEQDNGDTVEGQLKRALKELTGEETELIGGSRTDSGVHALDNVCVFDTNSQIPPGRFCLALNTRLPEDIRVSYSTEVEADFHPRHRDTLKTYEYHIYNARIQDPKKRLYSYFTYYELDVEAMKEAASLFVGEHDFSAFCAAGAQVDSCVRKIYSCEICVHPAKDEGLHGSGLPKRDLFGAGLTDNGLAKDGLPEEDLSEGRLTEIGLGEADLKSRDIIIRITGNGFLYNMVRIIAGTLLEVGRGAMKPSDIPKIIASKDRIKAGPTAPACGLTLMRYIFVSD